MKEIKFRAWDGEKMIFFDFNTRIKLILSDLYAEGKVMQYTDCKDKNGKEIYDGDIVKCEANDYWMIQFDKDMGLDIEYAVGWAFPSHPEDVEVVGNYFETPELVKKC